MNDPTERARLIANFEERLRAIDVKLLDCSCCPGNNRAAQLHTERVQVKRKLQELQE